MIGFENLSAEVAKDLIEFINNIKGLEKSSEVKYNVKTKDGKIIQKQFRYVPLDIILNKVKESKNFAMMLPIGADEQGNSGVKCVLIHKSGHMMISDTYPFKASNSSKIQDEGAEITYRKRYAIGSFLGMATEEDTDGNDDSATGVTMRKASEKQINILKQQYKGKNLSKLLEMNNIEKIEDIPMEKASELIGKIFKSQEDAKIEQEFKKTMRNEAREMQRDIDM